MAGKENLIKIFEYALNQEHTGLSFFQASLARMGQGAAVTAFRRLIAEEEQHIAFLNRILSELREARSVEVGAIPEVKLEPTDFFDERSRKEFLEQCVEGSMVPDVTVFNTAWLIEKDLSDFYVRMAQQAQGKAQEALSRLAAWEKGHELFFRQFRDKLSEVYAHMPWGG